MSTNPLLIALGQALPDIRNQIAAEKAKQEKIDVAKSLISIQSNPNLTTSEKYDRMGTVVLPYNPEAALNYTSQAQTTRDAEAKAKADFDAKTLEQKLTIAKPLLQNANNSREFNSLLKSFVLQNTIPLMPDGSTIPTKAGDIVVKIGENPLNDNKTGVSLINKNNSTVQWLHSGTDDKGNKLWMVPKSTVQKTQVIKSKEDFLLDSKFKEATKEQMQNPDVKLITPEGSDVSFVEIKTPTQKMTTALDEMEVVSKSLQKSIETMNKFNLSPDPITGRIPIIGDDINIFTKSPEWQTWQANIDRTFQKFRNITTGQQASDSEIRRLIPLMPTSRDRDKETFTMKALDVINEMNTTKSRLLQIYEGQGYDVSSLLRSSDPTTGMQTQAYRASGLEDAVRQFNEVVGRPPTEQELEAIRKKAGGI